MQRVKELTVFYDAIKDDSRIGPTHISLYMAIFQLYNLKQFCNPINITRVCLMDTAKISGLATYHKCIKDLHEFGYIQYVPSYNPAIRSRVFLLKVQVKKIECVRVLQFFILGVVPLGLILNEIITNAFKYAFPYSGEDKISIQLRNENEKIFLIVTDNGRGLPENYKLSEKDSFGMTLMHRMAEDLEGNFTIENHNGTKITVTV